MLILDKRPNLGNAESNPLASSEAVDRTKFDPPELIDCHLPRTCPTMMSFRPCVIAAMLLLFWRGAMQPASVAAGNRFSPPAHGPKTQRRLSPAGAEVFRKQVRPLFIKHCYQCHSSQAKILKGGPASRQPRRMDEGRRQRPGDRSRRSRTSLLIEAIRYQSLEMPPKGKLSRSEIGVLEKWVRMGSPDPRTDPVHPADRHGPTSTLAVRTGHFDRSPSRSVAASKERCLAAIGHGSIHSR